MPTPERRRSLTHPGSRAGILLVALAALALAAAGCGGSDSGDGGSSQASGGKPAGADKTQVTSWADPRPAAWGRQFAAFGPAPIGDGSLARAQTQGLKVCTNNQVTPFTFKDPKTGKLRGFEVDMLGWMTKYLGISKVNYVNLEWQSLIAALSANKCDMVMAGIAIRLNRENAPKVKFTVPYFLLFDQVTVRNDSQIASVDDLAGKKIASVVGSTDADNLDLFLKSKGMKAKVVKFNGYNECFQAVVNRLADACWLDEGTTLGALKQYRQLKPVGQPFLYQPSGQFAAEGKASPYVFGSVGMVTRQEAGDLNRALSIADVAMVKSGVQKQLLEKIDLWSAQQTRLVRGDTGWTGTLVANGSAGS